MTNYLFKITFPMRNLGTFSPFTPLPNQNFFNSYGDIFSYNKNSREGYIIIKYESDGCIRREN